MILKIHVSLRRGTIFYFSTYYYYGWLPTKHLASLSSPPTTQFSHHQQTPSAKAIAAANKDYSQKQFWRYDEAAPQIQNSRVHILSSVPRNFRLTLEDIRNEGDPNITIADALDRYANNTNNVFPQKHHLAEFNPSVAKLPKSYLTNDKWLQTFGGNGSQPIYLATYRISNFMACYFGLKLNKIKFNNDYNNWMRTKPKTEFIGFALLNSELDIVADITVNFGFKRGVFGKNYQDFRIFNLRGGDGEKEMLYISTFDFIVPIQLTLDVPEINESLTGYTKLHPPDIFLSTNITTSSNRNTNF